MKKFIFLLTILITATTFSQQGINYKAIVKDNLGNIEANNNNVVVQFKILQGVVQTNVYEEIHTTFTNANGILIVNIGEGIQVSGDYTTIDWASDDTFLNVQINTGAGLVDLGTTQFMAVPYAKHATTAANVTGLETLDEGNGIGWRIKGRDPVNYANIGAYAVDLSFGFVGGDYGGASGIQSTALGINTNASGDNSTVLGFNSSASGDYSTAMGRNNIAAGIQSTVMGFNSVASGTSSTAIGEGAYARSYIETAIGSYNTSYFDVGDTTWEPVDRLFIVGNGSDLNNKSDAFMVLKNGTITAPSFDLAEITDDKALVTKEYVDNTTVTSINDLSDGKADANGSSLFLGVNAGANDDGTDNGNIGIGFGALDENTIGAGNIATGSYALSGNITGNGNIAIGSYALYGNNGSGNIALGTLAGFDETGSNKLYIDNSGTNTPLIYGDFENDLLTLNGGTTINSSGAGLEINAAAEGIYVKSSVFDGILIDQPGYSGVRINSPENDGIQISSAGNDGIWISQASDDGIQINDAGANGIKMFSPSGNGILINSPGADGIEINSAGFNGGYFEGVISGVHAASSNDVNPDIILGGTANTAAGDNGVIASVPNYLSSDIFIRSNDAVVVQLNYDNGIESGGAQFEIKDGNQVDVFEVRDSGNATLAGSLTQNSDRRLKKDIETLPYGLKEILQLQPKAYNWKSRAQEHKSLGLIAQEVQPIIKEIVNASDDEMKTLGISYTELIPVLINAIKEQQMVIESLQLTADSEKFKVATLESDVSELKTMVQQLLAKDETALLEKR